MSELCHSFGLTVRHLREAQCWSQEVMAEKTGLNRSYVGEVERGKAVPSLITVEKIAAGLGLSMADLLAHCERRRHARMVRGINLASIAC